MRRRAPSMVVAEAPPQNRPSPEGPEQSRGQKWRRGDARLLPTNSHVRMKGKRRAGDGRRRPRSTGGARAADDEPASHCAGMHRGFASSKPAAKKQWPATRYHASARRRHRAGGRLAPQGECEPDVYISMYVCIGKISNGSTWRRQAARHM